MESTDIIAALRKSGGNVASAAALLGVTRACVYKRMKDDAGIASAAETIRAEQAKHVVAPGEIGAAIEALRIDTAESFSRAFINSVTPRSAAYDLAIENIAAATRRSKADVLKRIRADAGLMEALAKKLPAPPRTDGGRVLLSVQITHAQGVWLSQFTKGSVARILPALVNNLPTPEAVQRAANEVIQRNTSFRVSLEAREKIRAEADRLGVTISAVFRAIVNDRMPKLAKAA